MATQITNLLSVDFAIPAPIADVLAPREKKQYPNVPYADLINDLRFDDMVDKHQILIEDEEPTSRPVPEVTTSAMNLWVSTTGSDNNPGNKSRPLNTLTAAIALIPRIIAHPVHIRVAAGNYVSFPESLNYVFDGGGQLVIEGQGVAPVAFGPYTLTSYTSTGSSRTTLVVTGAGWTPDEFYGKWVRFTSGAAIGRRIPVYSNTTDTIVAPVMWDWATGVPANPDTFEIVDPPVSVTVDHPVYFVQAPGANGAKPDTASDQARSRLSIAGFLFYSTQTYARAAFHAIGETMNLNWCTLKAPMGTPSAPLYPIQAAGCDVNIYNPVDPTLFDDSQLADMNSVGLQLAHGTVPPAPGGTDNYIGSASENARLAGLCSRAQHHFVRGEVYLEQFCLTAINCASDCDLDLYYGYLNDLGLSTIGAIYANVMAIIRVSYVHIESIGGADAIDLVGSNRARLRSVTSNSANVSGYGARIGPLCSLQRNAAATVDGTTNDYIFVKGAAAGAWPASTATDAAGCFITTE